MKRAIKQRFTSLISFPSSLAAERCWCLAARLRLQSWPIPTSSTAHRRSSLRAWCGAAQCVASCCLWPRCLPIPTIQQSNIPKPMPNRLALLLQLALRSRHCECIEPFGRLGIADQHGTIETGSLFPFRSFPFLFLFLSLKLAYWLSGCLFLVLIAWKSKIAWFVLLDLDAQNLN